MCSPTWHNLMDGQVNLIAANKRNLEFVNPNGSVRKLNDTIAQLFVRTRGWHLDEKHVSVDGQYMSGGYFVYFFNKFSMSSFNLIDCSI